MSFSQGGKWKALIRRYIGIIPPSGDTPAIEHNASAGPPPSTPVSSAMTANVGAAASDSQRTARAAVHVSSRNTIFEGQRMLDVMIVDLSCSTPWTFLVAIVETSIPKSVLAQPAAPVIELVTAFRCEVEPHEGAH